MKKVTKALVVLLSICLLFSLTSVMAGAAGGGAKPNEKYNRPDTAAYQFTDLPIIDGILKDSCWTDKAQKIDFTQKALQDGSGQLWSYTDDDVLYEDLPSEVGGTAYLGWSDQYFFFALEVTDNVHENSEATNVKLWAGDCLQIQIGPDANKIAEGACTRYELGFALSTFTKDRRLGYQWFPVEAELNPGGRQKMESADKDYYYYVSRDEATKKTTYEIALKYSYFGRTEKLADQVVIPFSFSLHLYSAEKVDTNGYFMEWAKGVVGGDLEKNIDSAARITLLKDKGETTTTTTTTTAKSKTTTTTTAATGNLPGGDTNPNTNTNTEDTTTVPVTTTTPQLDEITVYYSDENATDVDDATIVDALKAKFEGKNVIVKSFVPGDKKFAASADALEGMFVKDAEGNFVELTFESKDFDNPDGSISTWNIYDLSDKEENVTVYAVKDVPLTTTVQTTTKATTTTKAAGAAATTAGGEDGKTNETTSSSWWIWVLVVVAVLVVAGVIVFFVLKKKNDDSIDGDDNGDDNTDAPSEE